MTTAVALPPDRVAHSSRALRARPAGRSSSRRGSIRRIIGGVVTRVGSTVYDGSVTTQLQKLKARLVEAEG